MSCKTCETHEFVGQLDVDQLVAEQLALELDILSEEEQQERLTICQACPFLSQHTCTKCGCFVKFRVALRHKSCPVKGW